MLDEEQLREMLTLVRNTFNDVPRPDCTKRVARALDDEWFPTPERVAELRALDTEQHWWDVPDDDIEQFGDVLPWLSGESFRFYYPAYLSYALRRWSSGHNRVHLEVVEVIARESRNLSEFSATELAAAIEVLTRLGQDELGYDSLAATTALRRELETRHGARP